ncbi:MAG: hypothetical protein ABFD58_02550 [Anaerolineaceae bacterium]|jgi:hypothetical protein
MIQLPLDDEELQLLKEMAESALSDLRVEIHSTDNLDYKEMLKKRKEILVKILEAIATEQKIQA